LGVRHRYDVRVTTDAGVNTGVMVAAVEVVLQAMNGDLRVQRPEDAVEGESSMTEEESKVVYRVTNRAPRSKVSEAAVAYIAGRQGEDAVSTISSKNQITLPAHLLREMGLGAGDRLAINIEGNRMVLRARPRDWVAYHGGSLAGLYGKDRGEIDTYLEDLRADRQEEIEEAWSGREPPPRP
jgi:bifunctional DNA-binding transcriptional regulator/antitoxin component of YhaV-PrlF toxin-antitoxin module